MISYLVVGNRHYFASPCINGKTPGDTCEISLPGYREVRGHCTPAGHCRGPCLAGECEEFVKLSHQTCSTKDLSPPPPTRTPETIEVDTIPRDCNRMYNPKAVIRMERICTDCYNMYREIEVYHQCTEQCFTSQTFLTCAKSLLINKSEAKDMVQTLG